MPAIAEILVGQVRPHYIVKIDEHVYVHELPPDPRRLLGRADVSLARPPTAGPVRPGAGLLEAPARVEFPAQDVERLAFVEIRDRRNRDLVAVVELLSPSHKRPGADREQYLAKRGSLLASRVHLVELDLLRGGRPMPLTARPECQYSALVSRAEDRPGAGFWPIGLADRLPVIPVPLLGRDEFARLDLQQVLDRVYDASGYEDYLHGGSPDPPLSPEESAWASQFLPRAE